MEFMRESQIGYRSSQLLAAKKREREEAIEIYWNVG